MIDSNIRSNIPVRPASIRRRTRDELPMVMTLEQLCAYAQVGADTVRMWINLDHDPLPHQRMSNSKYSHIRFRRDLFDDWQRRQMGVGLDLAS